MQPQRSPEDKNLPDFFYHFLPSLSKDGMSFPGAPVHTPQNRRSLKDQNLFFVSVLVIVTLRHFFLKLSINWQLRFSINTQAYV